MNLLKNPSFETLAVKPELNRALVITPDPASPQAGYWTERGEINAATHWTPWYVRDEERPPAHDPANNDGWCEPEIRPAPHAGRQLDGLVGQLMFTFYRIHAGGYFQQVSGLTPGQTLHFSAHAHAWTGSGDDPLVSLDGIRGAYAVAEGTTGAQRQATFWVGVDPTGGTNPDSASVVWSTGYHIYNVYAKLAANAVAQSDTVTVFVRQRFLYPFKHCDGYWESAELTAQAAPAGYDRVYRIADPTYMSQAQLDAAYTQGRLAVQTTGPSWDDAVPEAKYRPAAWKTNTVEAGPLPLADRQRYLDWVAARDPATVVKFDAVDDVPNTGDIVAYKQGDPLWANDVMLPSALTLGKSGCLVTALCAQLSAYGITITPKQLNAVLCTIGGYTAEGLLVLDKPAELVPGLKRTLYVKYDTPTTLANLATLKAAMQSGPVIVRVDYYTNTDAMDPHFVLAVAYRDDDLYVMDPWTGTFRWLSQSYWRGSLALSVRGILVYTYTKPAPAEPQYTLRSNNLIGMHSGFMRTQSLPYIRESGTNLQKFFSAGDCYIAKQQAPALTTVWRKYVGNEEGRINEKPTIRESAVWYLDQYSAELASASSSLGISVDQLLSGIDAIESLNETIMTWVPDALKRSVEFDVCFAEECYKRYGTKVAAVLLCGAVGNPHETEVPLLLPAAKASVQYQGFLGYHAYWMQDKSTSYLLPKWQWHAGRWMEWDTYFRSQGVYPRYASGEGGICYAPGGLAFDNGQGWKACGSFEGYFAAIKDFNAKALAWNAEHGNRFYGLTLFGYGNWDWDSFELGDGEVLWLTNWAKGGITPAFAYAVESDEQRLADYMNALLQYLQAATYISAEHRQHLQNEYGKLTLALLDAEVHDV